MQRPSGGRLRLDGRGGQPEQEWEGWAVGGQFREGLQGFIGFSSEGEGKALQGFE